VVAAESGAGGDGLPPLGLVAIGVVVATALVAPVTYALGRRRAGRN
jgi:hypothetical protein